jgi:EAL domain-containing protein (putative c-di-GMP-specific phosphodiesterase class I)
VTLNAALAEELPGALERDELRLHFQPAIRLEDGSMRGAEALVRWQHPELGLVPPAQFIPAAEEGGLMRAVGQWVLEQACRQVTRWNRLVRPALVVSVNLSARQLHDPEVVADVRRVLRETETDARHVCLEVSERALAAAGDGVVDVLERLKTLGVQLAVDNFGSGPSVLAYLRMLPVDQLKLDRVLTDGLHDPRGVVVVQAVVDMAHALGMAAVAEGVETADQVKHLQAVGCDLAQGYFLGRPGEPAALTGLLG